MASQSNAPIDLTLPTQSSFQLYPNSQEREKLVGGASAYGTGSSMLDDSFVELWAASETHMELITSYPMKCILIMA